MKFKHFFKLLLLIATVAGCGQMGPLYLPDAPPPIHVKKEKPATEKQTIDKQDESEKSPSSDDE
jgi:predicted small lipoprotein YifL